MAKKTNKTKCDLDRQELDPCNDGKKTVDAGKKSEALLPNWCNVYDGLTDQEIAGVEEIIRQRSDMTRPSGGRRTEAY